MPRAEQLIIPMVQAQQIFTAGAVTNETLDKGVRGLIIGTAGILDVTLNGVPLVGMPFVAGLNPGLFESIEITGIGTALNIWAYF